MDVIHKFKINMKSQIWIMGVQNTSDQIKINIKMSSPSQEPPMSSKALNQDLKGIDVLCTLKINIGSKLWNMGVSKTTDHIEIKIKTQSLSRAPYQD